MNARHWPLIIDPQAPILQSPLYRDLIIFIQYTH
jgi:hypothetical protein